MSRLTAKDLAMLAESGHDRLDGCGFGVELRGAGAWATARRLVARELGWIEGGAPQGSELPGLFFANADGVACATPDPDPDIEEEEF